MANPHHIIPFPFLSSAAARVIISQPFTHQPFFRPARPSQGRHPCSKLLPPALPAPGPAEPAARRRLPTSRPASRRLANETKEPQLTAAPQVAPTLNAGERGRQLQVLSPQQQFETASNEGATSGLPNLSHTRTSGEASGNHRWSTVRGLES